MHLQERVQRIGKEMTLVAMLAENNIVAWDQWNAENEASLGKAKSQRKLQLHGCSAGTRMRFNFLKLID